jgi:hypothetical protein
MALTNREKQKRWRERHSERRRNIARIAKLLMRRSHVFGKTLEVQLGWNWVTFDLYFLHLARLLCVVLKTDRAIMQLQWGLAVCLKERKQTRYSQRSARAIAKREAARNIAAADASSRAAAEQTNT